MSQSKLAAIDSGAQGAIVIMDFEGDLIDVIDMPYVEAGLSFVDSNAMYEFMKDHDVTEIAIEEVRGIKGKSTMQTVFRQGGSYFPIGHACWMLGVEPELIDPKKWKNLIGVNGKKDGSEKKKMFELACKAYPHKLDLFTGARGGMKDGRTDAIGIGLAYLRLRNERKR